MLPNEQAEKIIEHLREYPGVEKVTPAGSLRRGRETVGDLDILVTGKACCDDAARQELIDHIIKLPGLMEIIARGENKISFRLRGGMQVDVRLLPPESFGAAMQYFTGSKGPQRRFAPARAEDGLHLQRIQPGHDWKRKSRSRAKPKRKSTPSLSWTTFLPNCGRIWARSTLPKITPCLR